MAPIKKQILMGSAATLGLVLILAAVKGVQIARAIGEAKKHQPPPAAVTTALAALESWPEELSAVGELAPIQGAILSAEEPGRVSRIVFAPGSRVNRGEVLVELDASVEQAELEAAEAGLELAVMELRRQQALRAGKANSVADLQKADAAHREARAQVEQLKARIGRKRIVAPFAGQSGAHLVNEGQVIPVGTHVVSLQSLDRLYLNFGLPQRFIEKLKPGLEVSFTVDAYPGRAFRGSLATVEPEIDPRTRNVSLQATVDNATGELRPGMFARVTLALAETQHVVAIPATGISFAPYGDTVYIVEQTQGPEGRYLGVRQQIVKLGRRRGDLIAVLSGLEPNAQVVTSGAFKLRNGAPVMVNNNVTPPAETAPQPADT